VLDVSLELFSEHGFEGTTLQQIADRLGVSKAALYYHFESPKDEILKALVAPVTDGIDALLDEYESRDWTPAERRNFLKEYLNYLLAHRRVIAYMTSDLAIIAHPVVSGGHQRRRARIEAMLLGDASSFREKVRLTMAFSGVMAVIARHPEVDAEELREALVDAASTLLRSKHRRPAA